MKTVKKGRVRGEDIKVSKYKQLLPGYTYKREGMIFLVLERNNKGCVLCKQSTGTGGKTVAYEVSQLRIVKEILNWKTKQLGEYKEVIPSASEFGKHKHDKNFGGQNGKTNAYSWFKEITRMEHESNQDK